MEFRQESINSNFIFLTKLNYKKNKSRNISKFLLFLFIYCFNFAYKHKNTIDIKPIINPTDCFLLIFSLNNTKETSIPAISGIPFTIGNIIALSTTPAKYEFEQLQIAATIAPKTVINIKLVVLFLLIKNTGFSACFFKTKNGIKYKSVENKNAITKKPVSSPLYSEL